MTNVVELPSTRRSTAGPDNHTVRPRNRAMALEMVQKKLAELASTKSAYDVVHDAGFARGALASLYLLDLITDQEWTTLRNAVDAEVRKHG